MDNINMDVNNISSPVDPEPRAPSPVAGNDVATPRDDPLITDTNDGAEINEPLVPSTVDNDIKNDATTPAPDIQADFEDTDLESILLENQKFIDRYSISPTNTEHSGVKENYIEEEKDKEEKEEDEKKEDQPQEAIPVAEDFSANIVTDVESELEVIIGNREDKESETLLDLDNNKTKIVHDLDSDKKTDIVIHSNENETGVSLQETDHSLQQNVMAESKQEVPSAMCQYRWSKVVDTSSADIGFYPSYSENAPVLLTWNEELKAYYSVEQKIVCGDFHGNLVVGGNVLPVEQFNVRTYTFEVDLFIKDDVIENEVKPLKSLDTSSQPVEEFRSNNAQSLSSSLNMDANDREPEHISNTEVDKNIPTRPEDKSTEDFINSVTSSLKFEHISTSKRHSPVGDDAVKSYSEFSPSDNVIEDSMNRSWNSNEKLKDDMEKTSSRTSNQSNRQTDVIDDVIGDPGHDVSRANVGSVRSSLSEDRDSKRPMVSSTGHTPVNSPLNGSLRDSSSVDAIYRRPPSRTSDRQSPARSGRPGSDVDSHHSKEDQRTSISPAHSLSRTTPTRDQPPSHSSQRATPDTSFGRERIIENGDGHQTGSRPPSHPGSRHSSNHSSRAQSLSSITSEQELGQYMGHGSRSSSLDRQGPSGANIDIDDYLSQHTHARDKERPASASMASYSYQQQTTSDMRSMTPDNRFRVLQSPDYTAITGTTVTERYESNLRNADRVSNHSRASSRTITPTPLSPERENYSSQTKDLEDTILKLRKLLTKREAEVHSLNSQISDLNDINRSLREELDHSKHRGSGVREDGILELKQTIAEKEILATEVVSLRDELKRLQVGSGRNSASSAISDYSPNSPSVLQRKISDLEGHIKDMQEAHESATGKLSKAEHRIRSLAEENKDLKSRHLSNVDSQDVGGHNLRVELITLREDLRSMKERNFQLTEENMRLTEGSKGKDASSHIESKLNGSFRSDDGLVRNQPNSYKREVSYRTSYSNYSNDNHSRHHKVNREDLAPKDLRQDRSYTSTSKHLDMNTRPLLQRESLEQSRLQHYTQKKEISQNFKPLDTSKSSVMYSDRSRPDGEISEKLQSQRLADSSLYERKYISREKSPRSHSDLLEFRPRSYGKDDRVGERLLSDRVGGDIGERDYRSCSSGAALNSKEIFFNLKQRRANQWLQQDKYLSGNLEGHRHLSQRNGTIESSYCIDDVADDSDTATDILLAQEGGTRGTSHIRGTSPGSDESLGSLSDGDNGDSGPLRRRSKSVEFRRGQDGSSTGQLLRSGSATRPLNSLDSSRNSSGLRTVLPAPLVTQHNKGNLSASTSSLLNSGLTQGMRPFAPSSPGDIRSNDVVKFSRVGGRLTQGVVKYVGHLPGRSDVYLGVELDKDEGKHDGTFEGIRYFKCKPNKGVFVAFNKIVMAWAP